jgi:hypothetical protein
MSYLVSHFFPPLTFLKTKQNGFTNVLNGGGPKETDCWDEFGGL